MDREKAIAYNKKMYEKYGDRWMEAVCEAVFYNQAEGPLQCDGMLGPETFEWIMDGKKLEEEEDKDKLPDVYDDLFQKLAPEWMDWRFMKALSWCESGLNLNQQTGKAKGLMQAMPFNFTDAGLDPNLWSDPATNVAAFVDTAERIRKKLVNVFRDTDMADWNDSQILWFIAGWNSGYVDAYRVLKTYGFASHMSLFINAVKMGLPKYRWSEKKRVWQTWVLAVYKDLRDDGLYNRSVK